MTEKPRIVVLGGVGMIGRNFVKFCIDTDCCSYIRVADKAMPAISYFSEDHQRAFASDVVEYVQADLTRAAHIERAFDNGPFDYVFNLASETKCGQPEHVYESKCRDLVQKCALKAKEVGVKVFVEISTAFVYKSQLKQPADESAVMQPWTLQAKYKLEAENLLKDIPDLNYIILRPATVYGPGDAIGLMPRIVCAASYVKIQEQMRFLWGSSLRVNTVHVRDVCRAMWHVTQNGKNGDIFNLADKSDTDQGKINEILGSIFGIQTSFMGKFICNMAKLRMNEVVEDANEKHMRPWSDLCTEYSISNTPLSPFMDKEILLNNHLYINGSKIEGIGFEYSYPMLLEDEVKDSVQIAISQGIFPPVLA